MRLTIMKKSLFVLLVYSTLLTLSEVAYRAVFHISQLNVRQTAEAFVLIASSLRFICLHDTALAVLPFSSSLPPA